MLFLAVGDRGRASSRLRVWDHVEWFRSQGNCVAAEFVVPSNARGLTLSLAFRILVRYPMWVWRFFWADTIVIQESLLVTPLLVFKNVGKRRAVVFDFSDPIDMIGTGWKNFIRRRLFRSMTRSADHVIFENPAYYSDLDFRRESVSHVFGPVDVERYARAKSAWDSAADVKRDGPLVIGWTGSPATLHLIEHLLPVLDRIAQHRNISLMLIGVSKVHHSYKHLRVDTVAWTEAAEFQLVPRFNLGLFALDSSERSMKRGAGKLFIYLAAGVPFVASGRGIADMLMRESGIGFRVSADDEWEARIMEAIDSFEIRNDYCRRGLEYASNHLSYERYRETLLRCCGAT